MTIRPKPGSRADDLVADLPELRLHLGPSLASLLNLEPQDLTGLVGTASSRGAFPPQVTMRNTAPFVFCRDQRDEWLRIATVERLGCCTQLFNHKPIMPRAQATQTRRRRRMSRRHSRAPGRPSETVAVDEVPLSGGRITKGVVRVGSTVRRPPQPNSELVRALLAHLAALQLEIAPRYLGTDQKGREMFSYLAGDVPAELDASFSDATLVTAAQLIRRFHDATADTELTSGQEVVCHNDLSPCNFVFRSGKPVAMIDFDNAAPGTRLHDLGYAVFLWLNLGTDGPDAAEQTRRIAIFCDAYGTTPGAGIINAVETAVAANINRLRTYNRLADVEWWQAQLDWIEQHRRSLAAH
jgi:Phosphotransferase enzyme family